MFVSTQGLNPHKGTESENTVFKQVPSRSVTQAQLFGDGNNCPLSSLLFKWPKPGEQKRSQNTQIGNTAYYHALINNNKQLRSFL